MKAEWRVASLGESGVTLIDCDHRTPPAAEEGHPYVAIPQLKAGRLDLTDVRRISPEHFTEWTRKANPRGHDVVLSRRCNPGETAFVPRGLTFALGQNLVLLRSDGTKVAPEFLRWLARGPGWWEQVDKFINVGAVFDSLRCADVPKFELRIPPLDEQYAIAQILGTLDDKIELNHRTCETLEAMARALFKSWFVDFDPVRAKAEGRAPRGMDAATAQLFPRELVDSETGPIPKSWDRQTLRNLVELQRGTTYQGKLKGLDGPVLLGLGAIARNGGFRDHNLVTYGGESPPKLVLRPGDLFVSLKDVTQSGDLLGAVARVPAHVASGRLTQDTVKLTLLKPSLEHLVYRTLLGSPYREFCRSHATGTTNLGLAREDFLSYPVIAPSKSVVDRFNHLVTNFDARSETAVAESRALAELRDALLPKLLSGELSVAKLERAVEAAT